MQFLSLFKANVRANPARWFDVFEFDLLDLSRARSRLSGFGGIRREATYELFEIFNLGEFARIVRHHAFACLGRSRHVVVVIARVQPQFAEIEVSHVGAHAV